MKTILRYSGLLALGFLILSSCTQKISVQSLLEEMPDRTELTYFPKQDYKLKQYSSYNRKTTGPDEDGWWENSDMSHFIRVEENYGRREFVMFDHDGPGAIVRWWMTFWRAQDGILRIYLDNDSLPEIEGAPFDVISGQLIVPEPFSTGVPAEGPQKEWGHNLYFPIPFAEHCKVTYECDSLVPKEHFFFPDVFYNICYREYTGDVEVETFSVEALENIKEEIKLAGEYLLDDISSNNIAEKFDKEVQPGKSIEFEFDGSGKAIDFLSLQISADNLPQALRSTVAAISFDDNQTVWVPAGEFFGTGYKALHHKTLFNQTSEDGLMRSGWVMPYQEKCKISYINYGKEVINLEGEIGVTDYKWDTNSMYFAASWHEHYHLKTRSEKGWMFDLNYVDIGGKGLYVGDQVCLFNTAQTWWGEGDEKIFVDGEAFPSSIGTGSEDYYGYAFGHPEPFSHPFISQPSGAGNFVPEMTINMRHRTLDAIPFNKSISTNIEMWHWADCCINYALTAYFYVQDGFEININPDIEAVKKQVATSMDDFYSYDEECYTIENLKNER